MYDFSDYKTFKKLFRNLYYRKMTIDDAELKQDEFNAVFAVLTNYSPINSKYVEAKSKLLYNAKNVYKGREKIIKSFKSGIFLLSYDDVVKEQARYEKEEKNIRNENGLIDYEKLERLIDLKERDISDELVRKHFLVQDLGALLGKLKKSKNNLEKNEMQVNVIKSGLRDLREEIEDRSEEEKEIENPNEIVDIFENILEFNRQQHGQGLKILTPNQLSKHCILCTDQKNLQNKSIKVWSTLFKTWKQFLWALKTVKRVNHTDLN